MFDPNQTDRDYIRTHILLSATILVGLMLVVPAVGWLSAREFGPDSLARAMLVSTILPLVIAPPILFLFGHLGLKNHRLAREVAQFAYTDWLTGLANRRAFSSLAQDYLDAKTQPGTAPTLFLLDIDHFKAVNDRYGHDVGDTALVHVAQQITLVAGTDTFVARLGGEEFAVIRMFRSPHQAERFAQRLRTRIAETPIVNEAARLCITASVGACMFEPDDTLAAALKRADRALYASKRAGRNRVTLCYEMLSAPRVAVAAATPIAQDAPLSA